MRAVSPTCPSLQEAAGADGREGSGEVRASHWLLAPAVGLQTRTPAPAACRSRDSWVGPDLGGRAGDGRGEERETKALAAAAAAFLPGTRSRVRVRVRFLLLLCRRAGANLERKLCESCVGRVRTPGYDAASVGWVAASRYSVCLSVCLSGRLFVPLRLGSARHPALYSSFLSLSFVFLLRPDRARKQRGQPDQTLLKALNKRRRRWPGGGSSPPTGGRLARECGMRPCGAHRS